MVTPNYKSRYWFQNTGPLSGKYRLQVFELGEKTEYLYLQNWNFANLEELLAFVENHFPGIQPVLWDRTSQLVLSLDMRHWSTSASL